MSKEKVVSYRIYIHEYKQYICFSVVYTIPHEVCLKCFETKRRWKAQRKENQLTEELVQQLAVDQSSRESGR